MMSEKITKAEARRAFAEGGEWDVTNHYITREDHPCYGTVRRTMGEVNTASWGWVTDAPYPERLAFSRFAFERSLSGAIRVYGHPDVGDLFLTMVPS